MQRMRQKKTKQGVSMNIDLIKILIKCSCGAKTWINPNYFYYWCNICNKLLVRANKTMPNTKLLSIHLKEEKRKKLIKLNISPNQNFQIILSEKLDTKKYPIIDKALNAWLKRSKLIMLTAHVHEDTRAIERR